MARSAAALVEGFANHTDSVDVRGSADGDYVCVDGLAPKAGRSELAVARGGQQHARTPHTLRAHGGKATTKQ